MMTKELAEALFNPILDSAPDETTRYWRRYCYRVGRIHTLIDALDSSDPNEVQAAKDGIGRLAADPEAIW